MAMFLLCQSVVQMSPRKLLHIAAEVSRLKDDGRCFYLGAVALRKDGVLVSAYNGMQPFPAPEHHCEARLAKKLDRGAVVYLARTSANGEWANSKPCQLCEMKLRKAYVKRVYYTVSTNQFKSLVF